MPPLPTRLVLLVTNLFASNALKSIFQTARKLLEKKIFIHLTLLWTCKHRTTCFRHWYTDKLCSSGDMNHLIFYHFVQKHCWNLVAELTQLKPNTTPTGLAEWEVTDVICDTFESPGISIWTFWLRSCSSRCEFAVKGSEITGKGFGLVWAQRRTRRLLLEVCKRRQVCCKWCDYVKLHTVLFDRLPLYTYTQTSLPSSLERGTSSGTHSVHFHFFHTYSYTMTSCEIKAGLWEGKCSDWKSAAHQWHWGGFTRKWKWSSE